jgi:hypothetical protein
VKRVPRTKKLSGKRSTNSDGAEEIRPVVATTSAVAPSGEVPTSVPPAVDPPASPPETPEPAQPKPKALGDYYTDFLRCVSCEEPLKKQAELNAAVQGIIASLLAKHEVRSEYTVLMMFDNLTLMRQDTDKIYQAISALPDASKKPVALIINSAGGSIEAGYLISKLCREFSPDRFVAIVPRRAKSAATLICCGADEIHMGSMSELGPIDPQFDNLPALGLKSSVQHLAELASQYPGASEFFAKYLSSSLKLIHLGYYERVAESAVQYAERLLSHRKVTNSLVPREIAHTLVYGYKDHSFVIDRAEAERIFGNNVIKPNTPEYYMGNAVYEGLAWVERVSKSYNHHFYLYGSPESTPNFFPVQ